MRERTGQINHRVTRAICWQFQLPTPSRRPSLEALVSFFERRIKVSSGYRKRVAHLNRCAPSPLSTAILGLQPGTTQLFSVQLMEAGIGRSATAAWRFRIHSMELLKRARMSVPLLDHPERSVEPSTAG